MASSFGAPTHPWCTVSAHTTVGDVWRAPTRSPLKIHLAAGVRKTEANLSIVSQRAKHIILTVFDGRQQDNAGNLSRPRAGVNTNSSVLSPTLMCVSSERRRPVVGCLLSLDRMSIVVVGQRWPRLHENRRIGPHNK